jgi:hypothetical protein
MYLKKMEYIVIGDVDTSKLGETAIYDTSYKEVDKEETSNKEN